MKLDSVKDDCPVFHRVSRAMVTLLVGIIICENKKVGPNLAASGMIKMLM
jgi:hypothetical protein